MIQILIGIVAGILLASVSPEAAVKVGFLGGLFVSALKAVRPYPCLYSGRLFDANQKKGAPTNMRPIIILYLFGTLMAALTAVTMSFLFRPL